jgi:4-hydroxy-tetrahydrodipicolinate reductase
MNTLKVVVNGALGRMGQEVLGALCRDPVLEAVAGVDIKAESGELHLPDSFRPIPLLTSLEPALECYQPHVMVDFSTASAAMPAIRIAAKHSVGLVIGTTGLSAEDHEEIKALCREHTIGAVVAPNFSLAAAVMIHLAKIAARFFDSAEIIELHHDRKADAPSGTALATARAMIESKGEAFSHTAAASESIGGSRGGVLEGIALHSVRLPGMLAHQEIILGAPGETLRIRLDQISREAFMPCVVLAVKKVVELKEAVFGLSELLGVEMESC